MKKRVFVFFFSLIMLLGIFSNISIMAETKEPVNINLLYFGQDTCLECNIFSMNLELLKEDFAKEGINLNITTYETTEDVNKSLLLNYDETYKVPKNKQGVTPTVFIGEKSFVDDSNIEDDIKNEVLSMVKNSNIKDVKKIEDTSINNIIEKATTLLNEFTPITVLTAGLIDGINPCAIAMLLFFISFLTISKKNQKEILLTGFFFILATFIAYFGIGVGLLKAVYFFKDAKIVMIVIYSITVLMSLYLSFLYLKDYFKVKNGEINEIQTQLSKNKKHKIHDFIKKHNTSKMIYLSAFISGFTIAFLEFSCTGQIYLPTITFLLSTGTTSTSALIYLLMYNIAFIIPLVCIVLSVYFGKKVFDISNILVSNLHKIKILGCVFFFLISIVMIMQIIKII